MSEQEKFKIKEEDYKLMDVCPMLLRFPPTEDFMATYSARILDGEDPEDILKEFKVELEDKIKLLLLSPIYHTSFAEESSKKIMELFEQMKVHIIDVHVQTFLIFVEDCLVYLKK